MALVIPLAMIGEFAEYILHRSKIKRHIDAELDFAATFAREILPADYHDKIVDESSVSIREYDRIVSRYNTLCRKLELEYIWSLMLHNEQAVFTTSTSPDKKVENQNHAMFLELHSNPELYASTFESMEIQYQDNIDQWEGIRAALIPYTDIHGRKYLFGASKKLDAIDALSPDIMRNTLVTALVFLVPGLLFSFFFSRWLSRPITNLATTAEQIGAGNYNAETAVEGPFEVNVISAQLETIQEHTTSLHATQDRQENFQRSVNNSPAIFTKALFDDTFTIQFVSDNISVTGYTSEQMVNGEIQWDAFIPIEDLDRRKRIIVKARESGQESYQFDTRMIWADGSTHWYESCGRFIYNDSGTPTHVQGFFIDITERITANEQDAIHRKHLEETMRELQKFQNMVISSPILIYRVKMDKDLTTEFITDNFSIMGYDPDKFRSGELKWKDILKEDQLVEIDRKIQQTLADKKNNYVAEIFIRWASGEIHYYKCWNQFIRDEHGTPVAIQGIMTDITDLKNSHLRDVEYQSRLKALARKLVQVENRERRHLAYVLHDDIGQMLAALNMKFSALSETTNQQRIPELVAQVDELIGQIMESTKTLTWEISPTSLYETDMAAGLEHMADDLKNFFGLDVSIITAGIRVELDRETSAFTFRCTRELLINTAKHSGQDHAEVGISQYGDKVHLVVSDQGKGFNLQDLENSVRPGFGLFSIRERLESIHGAMHIESAPGQGTKIMLIIPLDISALL